MPVFFGLVVMTTGLRLASGLRCVLTSPGTPGNKATNTLRLLHYILETYVLLVPMYDGEVQGGSWPWALSCFIGFWWALIWSQR